MDGVAYSIALALLALVPNLGETRAKVYGDSIARASVTLAVDPWLLVAVGRVETNWNADNIGACCGGVMSVHWTGWSLYAARRGLATDRRSLERLARDAPRSIELGAQILASMQRMCGPRAQLVLGAYQSGACRSNEYGRRVARIASRYRRRYGRRVRRRGGTAVMAPRVVALPPLICGLGTPGLPPGPLTDATLAAGP